MSINPSFNYLLQDVEETSPTESESKTRLTLNKKGGFGAGAPGAAKEQTGGQAKIDKNKNNKIDAEDFKILRGGAFSGKMFNLLSKDVISRAFPQTVGQKDREKQMYMEQKSKYEEPQKLSQGGGIAIKGTKFKGVF